MTEQKVKINEWGTAVNISADQNLTVVLCLISWGENTTA